MTARRIGVFFFWLWLGTTGLKILALMFDMPLPIPSGLFFWGIFTPFFYNWARARTVQEDRALFLLELADLLRLGIPLPDAVKQIATLRRRAFGHKYSEFTPAIRKLSEKLDSGDQFLAALETTRGFPRAWSDFLGFVEEPEKMADALEDLSNSETVRLSFPLLSMVRLQLLVPIVLGVVLFLVTYILPTFVELFKGMNLTLPLSTRWLISGAELFRSGLMVPFWIFLTLIFLSLVSYTVRGWFWTVFQYLPGLRKMVILHSQARVYLILAAGLEVGAPLQVCFTNAAGNSSLSRYRSFLNGYGQESVAEFLSRAGHLFEPRYVWIIQQAEQLEHLPQGLRTAAELCQAEMVEYGRRLVVTIDTVVLALIGAFVAFAVLSVWLPLYQMIGNLG